MALLFVLKKLLLKCLSKSVEFKVTNDWLKDEKSKLCCSRPNRNLLRCIDIKQKENDVKILYNFDCWHLNLLVRNIVETNSSS